MPKKFNYTGPCIPGKHYMVDVSGKLAEIMPLIEAGDYFAINRPRQFGKSTIIFLLEKNLPAAGFTVISLDFQGIGEAVFANEAEFIHVFTELIIEKLDNQGKLSDDLRTQLQQKISTFKDLSGWISRLISYTGSHTLLIIDEVDASSNNDLFLRFLGMLREKYMLRSKEQDFTFHSVILAGVHDVKNLKLKLRPGEELKYNSPWNIAVDFKVKLSFSPGEITTMLRDYAHSRGIELNLQKIAAKLYYYTSGYPFLVSKLCYIIDDIIMQSSGCWQEQDVEQAVSLLLKENNTNFQSLVKNLEHNSELQHLVYDLIMNGEEKRYNIHNPLIELGTTYGILQDYDGQLIVHNRIYKELIYNYLSSKLETSMSMGGYNLKSRFIKTDGKLDFDEVLLRFQAFMKEQYSKREQRFLEENGRLIFLAFIKPIINGNGYDFKEVQISEEKRLDVIITWQNQRFLVELKIWNGRGKHEQGKQQLAAYLTSQNCLQGYLVIFDFRKRKTWKQERLKVCGRQIFAVWV